jgi:enamine deaminase RidA (YjgF/YER057c/UK114 family)
MTRQPLESTRFVTPRTSPRPPAIPMLSKSATADRRSDRHRPEGKLVGKGDFEAQADQVFRNLASALAAVGCNAANLVKLTVFVRDMGNLPLYRRARNRFFASVTPPAAPGATWSKFRGCSARSFLIDVEAIAAAGASP